LNRGRSGHTDAAMTTAARETLPFQQRFAQVTDLQQTVHPATLVSAAIAAALVIAPSAGELLVALIASLYVTPWSGVGLVRRVRK
jgi:Family of unknown function (DUF6328)